MIDLRIAGAFCCAVFALIEALSLLPDECDFDSDKPINPNIRFCDLCFGIFDVSNYLSVEVHTRQCRIAQASPSSSG
jgi:hypothetical protein